MARPYNRTDVFFASVSDRPGFAQFTAELKVLTANGDLVAGEIDGPSTPTLPPALCRYGLSNGGGVIELTANIFEFEHTAQITYNAMSATRAQVSLGNGQPVNVELLKGPHDLFVRLEGGGTKFSITGLAPDASVCVDAVQIGRVLEKNRSVPQVGG
jgi:hypothetical protein